MLYVDNCIDAISRLPDESIDSIVTDPPYELGFMGKAWDSTGIAYSVELWRQCLRVLKPGGHLLSFGGSRTYHRMACAIEDAGFQIRDQIMWVYGSGFPKSLNISKSIEGLLTTGSANKTAFKNLAGEQVDRGDWGIAKQQFTHGQRDTNYDETASATRLGKLEPTTDEAKEWNGWGTALKPAHEPIVLARKPLDGTVANNVLTHGVGGLNIDGSRVAHQSEEDRASATPQGKVTSNKMAGSAPDVDDAGRVDVDRPDTTLGRFPANFIHDGSDEVLELFPNTKGGTWNTTKGARPFNNNGEPTGYTSTGSDKSIGSAARFFYCAKASRSERNEGLEDFEPKRESDRITTDGVGGENPRNRTNTAKANHHPTVKPVALMRHLVKLITPTGGTVLDPFMGSGTTAVAATLDGFNWVGCEMNTEYAEIINARVRNAQNTANNE
jgi:site-specific DNA-methyltransferase (adenine-specific)